ncbi:MAG: LptF/LptG family permease [Weeksellaceae bacterium]|nr:LptF/LptG family permease [Weeksellaceae bacterium]
MFKLLDRYIVKTFFGPFLFIFSVLFFIFIVNIVWIQLGQFMGKGLSYWEILKLLFYFGVGVINLVLPLTILLSSIMTFGELGERYELAAMKAAGISLTRVMLPLFFVSVLLSFILFLFQNNITPDFQRKAKNMLYNIAQSRPALNFTPGQFIDQIPGYLVKFDRIEGEKGENLEGIYIHRKANAYENQQSIRAQKGKLVPSTENKNYLKLILFDGYVFEDNIANKDFASRNRQPDQAIRFDTLTSHFDISEIINKAIEEEKITEDYRFKTYTELTGTIQNVKKENTKTFNSMNIDLISQVNPYVSYIDKAPAYKKPVVPQIKLDTVKKDRQLRLLSGAYHKIEALKISVKNREAQINPAIKGFSRIVLYQQRIIAYSVTCIIFFLIGASLGSIIRKGGMGLPVVIAIVIFIIFYVMNLSVENLAWNGTLNPYLAAWLPNLILFPFGVWLTYKALTDSQLFDVEKYRTLIKPITRRFAKQKEHQRYQ